MHHERYSKRLMRLDVRLAELGLVRSRAAARDLIRRGLIEVEGKTETRPAAGVAADASIRVQGEAGAHVSRGAAKLSAALEHFGFSASSVAALDIGASTGGFTDVLLAAGAMRVYAVDVGRGQLDRRLAANPRVVSLEGCDARRLDATLVPEPIGALVADVSFISLAKVLPAPLALTQPGAWAVMLIKPQFEAGREAVGKGGIVREEAAHQRAVTRVSEWMAAQPGWRLVGVIPSPIAGGSGNREFLLGAVRDL
jgi:23S rRNA (cytidine1920-2'-O)/16S rRNA (cytidine1409-2'-O)-methyltransferase